MPPGCIEERIRSQRTHQACVLPYFTAGFPDLATTEALIRRADALNTPVVEIGFPCTDSIADGPVIQGSFHAALERGLTLDDTFQLISKIRDSVDCALVAMVSYSLVFRAGVDRFMVGAAGAGFDGVILPDVPVEESATPRTAAQGAGLDYIGLVTPTTSRSRREAIVRASSGFLYQVADIGTTGERQRLGEFLSNAVAQLRQISTLPVCVGFGIGSSEQVRTVCEFADGAVVGSALVRRIAEGLDAGASSEAVIDSVGNFLCELQEGSTNPST